jgi:hypothetical protein
MNTKTARMGRVVAPRTFLLGIRAALAASALIAPRLSARLFGIDPVQQPAVPYLTRLFGGRNAVLALGLARLDAVRDPAAFLSVDAPMFVKRPWGGWLGQRRGAGLHIFRGRCSA